MRDRLKLVFLHLVGNDQISSTAREKNRFSADRGSGAAPPTVNLADTVHLAMAKTRGQKRMRERIPKEKRQNLRLWAEGTREKILQPHLDKYAQERDLGWVKERAYLQKTVCNEFHARVDWQLEDHEEPELKLYNPKEVIVAPQLSDDEEILKRQRIKMLNKVSHTHVTSHTLSHIDTADSSMVHIPYTPPTSPRLRAGPSQGPIRHPSHQTHGSNVSTKSTTSISTVYAGILRRQNRTSCF
jgi:hypothetical protein